MFAILAFVNSVGSAYNFYLYAQQGEPYNLAIGVFSGLTAIMCIVWSSE